MAVWSLVFLVIVGAYAAAFCQTMTVVDIEVFLLDRTVHCPCEFYSVPSWATNAFASNLEMFFMPANTIDRKIRPAVWATFETFPANAGPSKRGLELDAAETAFKISRQ
jgi:hypothetical protein